MSDSQNNGELENEMIRHAEEKVTSTLTTHRQLKNASAYGNFDNKGKKISK